MKISKETSSRIIKLGVACLIALYAILFIRASICRYSNFVYRDWDLAIYNQIFRGLIHGKPYISLLDVPFLGAHVEITMLLLVPIYALLPHPVTLLVIQSLMLGLAAIPLFLIVKEKLSSFWGLLFVIIYLLYPAVGYTNLNEFHPESFLPFIQFFMFYFFIKNDLKKFLVFMFLCLFAKENMALFIIMFGLYALFNRKGIKWVVLPILSGMVWFLFWVKFIIPNLTHGKIGFYSMYGYLGNNIGQIILTIVAHPVQIMKLMVTPEKLLYIRNLFGPLSFVSLLNPSALLLTVPYFLQHFLSTRVHELSLFFYYPAEILAVIFISAASGIGILSKIRFFRHNNKLLYIIVPAVALYFNALLGPQLYMVRGLKRECGKTGFEVIKNKFIDMIPEGSKVVATFEFLPRLSSVTGELYSFHRVITGTYQLSEEKFVLPDDVKFALIDFNDLFTFYNLFPTDYGKQNLRNFFKENNYMPIEYIENTVLFKKNHGGDMRLYEPASPPQQRDPRNIIFNDTIGLINYKMQKESLEGKACLHFTFYWQAIKKADKDYQLFAVFLNKDSKVAYATVHPLCYRIYSADLWKVNETIKEGYRIFIPGYLSKGNYRIFIGIFDPATGKSCTVRAQGGGVKPAYWINLGQFQIG